LLKTRARGVPAEKPSNFGLDESQRHEIKAMVELFYVCHN
jgi:hypothetical protein